MTPTGANVAVWSAHATAIEFCLFEGDNESGRVTLPGRTGPVFHGHLEGVGAGARYGLRAYGPFDPAAGHRFNPARLLVDPYALCLDRPFTLHPSLFDATVGVDSAAAVPKAVVIAEAAASAPPPSATPWAETVIYEIHVRGFTRAHPDIPEAIRGTFAALAHPVAVAHLKGLGVTTVELMPSAAWVDERHLPPLGLTNYWGYNPVAFRVPDPRLAPGGWPEVRTAVAALADAGIETVLDVVFNHTGEGDALGPTLSLRGLDNAAYYRLDPADPARYLNDAGTGNTLALDRGPALRLAMDALRAWRRLGGVAGFRFDLATTLGRRADGFDPAAPLLTAIDQDPELRTLKRIAEPWDIGPGGYRLGGFPPAWGEWNDRFRDTARGFWRGDGVPLGELARRLAGSQDIFGARRPSRSVNFVVSHDGFTLADLVSFSGKHNLANGEDGRDGGNDNRSWTHGVEGPTSDPAIRAARLADQRALLATLLLARGTPMLAMGSELGHTQGGNNNAYAQDNPVSWLDWVGADQDLIAFTARLVELRRLHPALRADRFLTGAAGDALYPDVAWRTPDGAALAPADWDDPTGRTLVAVLSEPAGDALDRVVVAIHRGPTTADLTIPEPRDGYVWSILADTADPARSGPVEGDGLAISPRSVVALGERAAPGRPPRGVSDAVLARLAGAAGIAPRWSGIDGAAREITPDTQRALLAAMRLSADTSQRALESLRDLAERHDRRALPFVVTGRPDLQTVVRLTLGAASPRSGWLVVESERPGEPAARVRWTADAGGERLATGRDGQEVAGVDVVLPPLPKGYYAVWREDRPDASCRMIIAPTAGHQPAALEAGSRLWGLSVQLYSLRRGGDQGIGDFTTLEGLAATATGQGAGMLAINPLHALFGQDRERASPYYPSDRRFLDPIYLDLERVPGAGDMSGRAPEGPAIHYADVWALKREVLEQSFATTRTGPDFDAFTRDGGETLRRFALFQAIAEAFPRRPWRAWQPGLQDPGSPESEAFARDHPARLRFHQYLQWLCERQLACAARASGGLGLCRDLAVGAAPDGAEIWAQASLATGGVSIGAPPDPIGPDGQVWGLPPFDPHRLRADAYRSLTELFAANMRHAGAVRVDHVMGLARQFWVPDGAEGRDGAYVAFPLAEQLAVLALESDKARCLVIGEDLGTVPEGLRETLGETGILSYRVLPFERDGDRFRPPDDYPRASMACVATHDLPPLAGWWAAGDIAERRALGLIDDDAEEAARRERARERKALLAALIEQRLLAPGSCPDTALTDAIAAAIHAFIAASGAAIAIAQVEDLAGETTAVNLPGTDRERPNWRRAIATPVEGLFAVSRARAIVAAMRADRSFHPGAAPGGS